MAEKKHGKLREIHVSVADNGYTARVHREAPEKEKKNGYEPWGGKPEETVHEDGESLMDHMHEVIAEHEGKGEKKKETKRVAGANLLGRKGKKEQEPDEDD
jgi:hypothetical protein